MCCDPRFDYYYLEQQRSEDYGMCPDCGEPTLDGLAVDSCDYSPVECETCDHRPCDGSC